MEAQPLSRQSAASDLLECWKEIASYLRRDIRTVQRWEICRGLPVHRLPGVGKASVYAHKSEVDAWRHSRMPKPSTGTATIAVLPFANLSGDPAATCFGEALADDIITNLAQLHWLNVTARTSTLAFRGWEGDMQEIVARLHTTALLEGAVKHDPGGLRISAQLIDTETGCHMWSGQFCCQGIDSVRDEIVKSISESVQQHLAEATTPSASPADPSSHTHP